MSEANPDTKEIQELIQTEFDRIDQQMSSHGTYFLRIAEFPQLSRDLYFVHDVVAITCNGGTRAWIGYHHDDPGWIEGAQEAFNRIGHPQVSEGIRTCLAVFLAKDGEMTYKDDEVPSSYIMEHEDEIRFSLYTYLVANSFEFSN